MNLADEIKIECRTPAMGRAGLVRIPMWKYSAVRVAILKAMQVENGDAISFKDLRLLAKAHMEDDVLCRLGSWGWHCTTVKLNMEVEDELKRVPDVSPQHLILNL